MTNSWSCFNISFPQGSVNNPGHYRTAATSQQLSDKERNPPHAEVVLRRIYHVLNLSKGLYCEWATTNEFESLNMPSVSLICSLSGTLSFNLVSSRNDRFCCVFLLLFMHAFHCSYSRHRKTTKETSLRPAELIISSVNALKGFFSRPPRSSSHSFVAFISPGTSIQIQARVQQCDTSTRSMATFARSQILSPSFSVTPCADSRSWFSIF